MRYICSLAALENNGKSEDEQQCPRINKQDLNEVHGKALCPIQR